MEPSGFVGSARRGQPRFHESQKFRQPWIWAILVISTILPFLLFTWIAVEQLFLGRAVGNQPMPDAMALGVWLGAGLLTAALLALFLRAELIVEVFSDALLVQFKAFGIRREIPHDELASSQAIRYSPIGEYGGWGIRGVGSKKAYNVSGDTGVLLTFHDGKTLLLGSQKARQLEGALTGARRDAERGGRR